MYLMKKKYKIILLVVFFCFLSYFLFSKEESSKKFAPTEELSYFPCSDCHNNRKTNPNRRVLKEEHLDIVFDHAEESRWCLDCHDPKKRNWLRLTAGKLISFDKSYVLCGQCHGTIYRDWKVGVHGKRTGFWNGEKVYRVCVHCHNPHNPKFKPLKPLPPPLRPGKLRRRADH